METTNIYLKASEIYTEMATEDKVFTTLSGSAIISAVCVELQKLLGRNLTEQEDDQVEEALARFGVQWTA